VPGGSANPGRLFFRTLNPRLCENRYWFRLSYPQRTCAGGTEDSRSWQLFHHLAQLVSGEPHAPRAWITTKRYLIHQGRHRATTIRTEQGMMITSCRLPLEQCTPTLDKLLAGHLGNYLRLKFGNALFERSVLSLNLGNLNQLPPPVLMPDAMQPAIRLPQ
jgi:hypothetical protein